MAPSSSYTVSTLAMTIRQTNSEAMAHDHLESKIYFSSRNTPYSIVNCKKSSFGSLGLFDSCGRKQSLLEFCVLTQFAFVII